MQPATKTTANILCHPINTTVQNSTWQKVQAAIIPAMVVMNVLLIFLIFCYSPIPDDAAYYLVVAREIAAGARPYLDLEVVYTPLALYLNSLVFLVMDGFQYAPFIAVQLLVVAGSAVTIYHIYHRKLGLSRHSALIAALLIFTVMLGFEGYYIVTEPYVVFFMLLAFYIMYKAEQPIMHIMGGLVLSFAFFSKQYGLFAVVPFAFLSYTTSQHKRNVFYFGAAYVASIVLFFLFFSGGQFEGLFNQLFTNPLEHKSKKLSDASFIVKFLVAGKVFYFLLLPLLIRVVRTGRFNALSVFCFGTILLFLAPLLFNQNQHHYIYTLPFIFIAYGDALQQKTLALFEKVLLLLLFLFFSFIVANRLRVHAPKKEEQVKISNEARRFFKDGENIFMMGRHRNLYLLNQYQNPLKSQLGYTWNYRAIEQQKELLHQQNVLFSFCFEKALFIDSLQVKPARYLCIEDCSVAQ